VIVQHKWETYTRNFFIPQFVLFSIFICLHVIDLSYL